MKEKVYLAVDLGAGSGRVLAARTDLKSLELEDIHEENLREDQGEPLNWALALALCRPQSQCPQVQGREGKW